MTESEESGAAALPAEREERSSRFWAKLKKGLLMTHDELLERIDAAVAGRAYLDDEVLEELEESLIGADLGVETTLEIIEGIKERTRRGEGSDAVVLRRMLVDEIAVLLLDAAQAAPTAAQRGEPTVTLVVGVNGVGKTTSVAKLARYYQARGDKVLLAAADTFRAAAVEQLALWGERLGVDVVKQAAGADPAAVVFDALNAGSARGVDHVLVDTAGRLHNKEHLMAELEKLAK